MFVGRDDVMGRLGAALKQAALGRGATVVICGDAGIGKSRVTLELEAVALAAGFRTLRGACFPGDRAIPSAWVSDMLRRLATDAGDAQTIVAEAAQAFVDQIPELSRLSTTGIRGHVLAELPPTQRVPYVLRRLAELRPTLLIAEDLHWSDASGIEALVASARVSTLAPFVLVATYRADDAPLELEEALAAFDRERLAQEISLHPLELADVEVMTRALLSPMAIDPLLVHRLYALTEGNPFFIEEILGRLSYPAGDRLQLADLARVPVPRAIRVTVRGGMNELTDGARRVLEAASVIGQRFTLSALTAVTAHPVTAVVQALADARKAGLVLEESPDAFTFRHALTREAVYDIVMGWERRRLHRLVAEEITRGNDSDPAIWAGLSDHWYRAEVWDQALETALKAASFALDAFAPGAAAALFDRAEEAAVRIGAEVPLALLRGRGRALELLGDFPRSRTDLEHAAMQATATGDAALMSATQLDLGWLWSSRDYERAGGYFHAALEAARASGDRGMIGRTLNRVGNWHLTADHPKEAIPLHTRALELFEDLGDAQGVAQSLDLLGTVELTLGDMVQAARRYLPAVDRFRELGDQEGTASALAMLSFCGLQYLNAPFGVAGLDLAERVERAHQALELTQAISWRSGQALSMIALANVLGYHGAYRDAGVFIDRGLALAEELHHRYWRTLAYLVRGAIRRDLLDAETAVSCLETAFNLAQEANSDYWARITCGHLVPALLDIDRVDRARQVIAAVTAGQDFEPTIPNDLTIGQRHVWVARAELALADRRSQHALDICNALEPPIPAAPLALFDLRGRALEALGRTEEAQSVWHTALTAANGAHVLPVVWRFHGRLARSLRAIGQRSEAADHVAHGWTILQTLATQLAGDEARRFTHAAAALVPRATDRERRKERFAGLTDREREVAAWVAQGLNNPEIARRLSLSSRTVEKHVEHVMAKIGASSRTGVVAWAIREQLVPEQHLPPKDT